MSARQLGSCRADFCTKEIDNFLFHRQTKAPHFRQCVGGEEPFLCFDFDCDSGFEVDGEAILEYCDLGNKPFDQRFVKLRDRGGLALNEILKVSDQPHLLVPDNAVNLGLLSHVPEPEDLVRDGIVVVFLVGLRRRSAPTSIRTMPRISLLSTLRTTSTSVSTTWHASSANTRLIPSTSTLSAVGSARPRGA